MKGPWTSGAKTVLAASVLMAGLAAAQTPVVKQEREAIYQDLTARQDAVRSDLERLARSMIDVEQWLAERGIAPEDLAARLAEVSTERARVAELVADLEQRVAGQQRDVSVDPGLRETVWATHALELEQLQAEIEALHRQLREVPEEVGLQTSVSLTGLSPRPFLLTGERIAPFAEPYFSSQEIRVRRPDRTLELRRRFDRVSDAGPTREAIEPGGVLAELVAAPDFDPAQSYVMLWVCADAIEGYRLVSEFLKARGVRYTWTTDVDEPWAATAESPEFDAWGYESR